MKTKLPTTISLTQEQIDWLKRQPNRSEVVGKIVDSMMNVELTLEGVEILQLKAKLDQLGAEKDRIKAAQNKFDQDEAIWKHFRRDDNYNIIEPPEPIDDDGRIFEKEMKGRDEQMRRVEEEIVKIKAEILAL